MASDTPTPTTKPTEKAFSSFAAAERWMDQVERAGTARITGYTTDARGRTKVTYVETPRSTR